MGISSTRRTVSRFGIFIGTTDRRNSGDSLLTVQGGINRLGKLFTNAGSLGDLVEAGSAQFLKTAEMRKQFATALRADARNLLKRRGSTRFSSSGTVAGNGETVRLIAHLLDQVQRRRVCGKRELVSRIVEVKGFQ